MKVQRFTEEPALTEAFVRFGFDLYRNDPRWIPPFREDVRRQLSPVTGLAHRPGDDAAHFLAQDERGLVGRISAFVNSDLEEDGEPIGTIGFFECLEDVDVARELFAAARAWLLEEYGIARVWGPMNFDIWHDYRLMTRGFSREPFSGEPWNKDYYPGLFARCGWEPRRTWESVDLDERGIQQTIDWGTRRHQRALEAGYRFREIDSTHFESELGILHGILSASYAGFLGYTPISRRDFVQMFTRFRPALVPGWFVFIHDSDGDLAGFGGAFLDLGDSVRAMRGDLGLAARLRFAWRRRRAHRAIHYVVGLTPAEAANGSGLGGAAICHAARRIQADGCTSVVAALMVKDGRSRSLVAGRGTVPAQREYVLYEVRA
jgi:hypothetical protein